MTMNNFNGRRAPNVSQYVANLNTIPSAHDMAAKQQDDYGLEDDLALFTNTEFYDFDLGENIQQAPPVDYDPTLEERARRGQAGAHKNNAKSMDFVNGMSDHPRSASACYVVYAIAISVVIARLWLPSPIHTPPPLPAPPSTSTSSHHHLLPLKALPKTKPSKQR